MKEPDLPPFDPTRSDYSSYELERYADDLLVEGAKEIDPDTGKKRGIGGENPILFAAHIKARERREIKTSSGFVEDSLTVNRMGQPGMYNRVEPHGGRRVNSEEARKKHGASWYRAVILAPIPLSPVIIYTILLILSIIFLMYAIEHCKWYPGAPGSSTGEP